MRKHILRHILIILGLLIIIAAGVWFWISRPDVARLSVDAVSGLRPQIAPPRPETIPTIEVADAVGWAQGATPTPAAGLSVGAFARGLDHPRWLYRLPN